MPTRRARMRRRFLKLRIPLTIAEYPLEVGLAIWGMFAWVNIITGTPPSTSLAALPQQLQTVWAAMMIVATLTIGFGLSAWKSAISRGLYLYGTTLVSFSVAIFSVSGWQRGGAVGGFLLTLGVVCFLRGWWLKEEETALRLAQAQTRRESGDEN